jgi:hypothetical protein
MSTNPNLTYTKDGSLDMRSKKNKEWLANQNKKNEQPNIIKHAPPIHNLDLKPHLNCNLFQVARWYIL